MGSRYWLKGPQPRASDERRPMAQFEELRAARLLRRLRKDKTGTYYSFTPAAFDYRAAVTRPPQPRTPAARRRPDEPPVEVSEARSRLDQLHDLAAYVEAELAALIEVSRLAERHPNQPGSGIFIASAHPWKWAELAPEHRPLLARARKTTEEWLATARHALAVAMPEELDRFNEAGETLLSVCIRGDRNLSPSSGTLAGMQAEVTAALNLQQAQISALPGTDEPAGLIFVPDTNALLADPAIEEWVLGDFAPVTIVVPPQVVTELDAHKVRGNDRIAPKADSLIRRFKEYSRRGNTLDGVKLVGNTVFRETAHTPNFDLLPDGLDRNHGDDQILASAIELSFVHLTSPVILVTRDRNLQNKARRLRLPTVDVADL